MDQHYKNQNNLKTDDCYINQQNKDNKSIFSYMTDVNMFINKNECFDPTPGFINYNRTQPPQQNIDIENDLRGAIRNNTRCTTNKWTTIDPDLASRVSTNIVYDKNICQPQNRVLPNGYYMDPATMTFVMKQ